MSTIEDKFNNLIQEFKEIFDALLKKEESIELKLGKVYRDGQGRNILIVYCSSFGDVMLGVTKYPDVPVGKFRSDGTAIGFGKGATRHLIKELPGLDITNWWIGGA